MSVRAHYAPVFSRLGPYDRDVLDHAAWDHSARSPRLFVEYWAHEAALMAVDDWPLLRWRMREYRHGRWGTHIVKQNPQLADDIVAAVEKLGPSTAGQIEAHLGAEPRGAKGPWWDRSDTKWVTEALFAAGVLTRPPASDSPATTTSPRTCCRPASSPAKSMTTRRCAEPTLRAATALGVGTEVDIRDYFRLSAKQVEPRSPSWPPRGNWTRDGAAWTAPNRGPVRLPRRTGAAAACPSTCCCFRLRRAGRSTFITASRSTPRPTSGSTAITLGRCWSTGGSSAAST